MTVTSSKGLREREPSETVGRMEVCFQAGESYEVEVREHRIRVDQPIDNGGEDTAPTPVELLVASLATCVAFYAGRYLTRHGYSRRRLSVSVEHEMATDRPARVAAVRLRLQVPPTLPADQRSALRAVAAHCTVHHTLLNPPSISIELA